MTLATPAATFVPAANPVSILTAASPLPEGVAAFDSWRGGLSQRNVHLASSGAWPVSCDVTATKSVAASVEPSEFKPFGVYVAHGCAGMVDAATYTAEAASLLDVKAAFWAARELWTGAVTSNPSLQSTATTVTSSAVSATYGVDMLLQRFLDDSRGARATLHAPVVAVGQLLAAGYVERVGDRLVTPHGFTVVTGPGYPATGSWGPGDAAAAAGEAWLYVSGTVELGRGEVRFLDAGSGVAARQNLVEVVAEQLVLVRFPPAPVFAALVTVS